MTILAKYIKKMTFYNMLQVNYIITQDFRHVLILDSR